MNKKTLSKTSFEGVRNSNFKRIFEYDTKNLKAFPIIAYQGLSLKAILQQIPACTYDCWIEGEESFYLIRTTKATISCTFNDYGICVKALLFPDH